VQYFPGNGMVERLWLRALAVPEFKVLIQTQRVSGKKTTFLQRPATII